MIKMQLFVHFGQKDLYATDDVLPVEKARMGLRLQF